MGMELLAMPYLNEFYSQENHARARRQHLEGLAQSLPWIATIDAFQHWLYTNPEHTHEQRRAYWEHLMERFGPAVSWDSLEDYRAFTWQKQLHIFEVPFYYIEYGIAQLGALQLWLQSRDDEARAIENYRNALQLGGSRPLPELFNAAGLKFDFGPDTVQSLMDEVQRELETLPL
jgi:oligoendopeptidase F